MSAPDRDAFLRDVLEGLSASPKVLKPKYFYDAEGSRLFEAITETPEYYPTRTETALLQTLAPELQPLIPENAALVEFGSGSATKTRILLDALPQLDLYVPIDISPEPLAESAAALRQDYPRLAVTPLEADFMRAVELPREAAGHTPVGFFPGSTIGNFTPSEAEAFLTSARKLLGDGALFLVGFDMVKPIAMLEAAYNDAAGVTAQFDKNLLVRINRELDGDIDVDAFTHESRWNPDCSRVEAHLIARSPQRFSVGGKAFTMAAGESIHTENAHKFTPEMIERLAAAGGWRVERRWTSPPPEFSVVLLRAR